MSGEDLSPNRTGPVVDFTSLDFDALRADFITFAQGKFSAQWTDFNDDQFAVVWLEIVAYLGDLLTYQLNATIREAFPATVVRRQNLNNQLKSFDLTLAGTVPATVDMVLTLDVAGTYPFTIGRDDHSVSNGATGRREVFFHPTTDTIVSSFPGGGTVTVNFTEGEFSLLVLTGVSDGTPNQRWQFPQTNVINDATLEVVVGGVVWTKVTSFVNQTSEAQVYKIVQNDFGQTFAIFGEGVFGTIPATSADIRATFNAGGGTRGNLNATVIDTIVTADATVLSVSNPEKSSGGSNLTPMKQARNVIPDSLSTLERGVTGPDYAKLALLVAGVSKAFGSAGIPAGSRVIRVFIAPNGGAAPSTALKNTVLTDLSTKKMATNRVRLFDPFYRDIRMELLIHVNPAFKAVDVDLITRSSLINQNGTGALDFTALNFAAIEEGTGELLISNTRLQDLFASQKSLGVDRVEIQRLDVRPEARAKDGGNTGSGTIAESSIITNTNQRRRRFLVQFSSAATYTVIEQITGLISSITDTVLTDDTLIFEDEGVSDFSTFLLQPDINDPATVSVLSAVAQQITVDASASLFALAEPKNEYLLFDPAATSVAVGSPFTSNDGSVIFTVTAGTTPFINGDEFTLDIFPLVGDIRLRADEYPQLVDADLTTRTSGGTGV